MSSPVQLPTGAFEVLCKCGRYLGESIVPLVVVDRIAIGEVVVLDPPRDVRVCKSCSKKVVFIPRSDIDRRRDDKVA